jgi:acetoin utilization deacetylase AcuC-like enzyme
MRPPRFVRRHWRRARHWLTRPHLDVVYHEQYNHAFPNIPNDPLRAERILAFLASEGLLLRRDVHTPLPVPLKTLERVHTAEYLERLHDPATLTSIMGVEVTSAQVDRILDLQRLQTGGTLLAARVALETGMAVNLGGGFHHARAGQGGGFCVFNDVAVAIAEARRSGFAGPVLVVDLDLHDGDGTRDIFARDDEVFTFSIHARSWEPDTARSSLSVELGTDVGDETYLAAVERHLPAVVEEVRPRLVFYLAGTDPAREDKIGEWKVTPAGMLRRDTRVVSLVRSEGTKAPLVVLLAGGYGYEAWRYTARFLSDPLGRRGAIEPPSTEEMTLKRYRYIASLLDPGELTGAGAGNDFGFSEEDLFLPGWAARKETRFLGYYTRHGIELVLERAGILDRLRDLGFAHPTLEFDLDEAAGHTVRIYSEPSRKEVLMEMRLARDRRSIPGMELLSVEWLLLQNPRLDFGPGRRRLPGQNHPGLGMLKDTVALLAVACERLHLDGIVSVPSTYHVAVQWHGYLQFLKDEAQARFDALTELLGGLPLAEATRAVAEGRVIDQATGEVFRWLPAAMVGPISERLTRELERDAKAAASPFRLRLEPPPDGPAAQFPAL